MKISDISTVVKPVDVHIAVPEGEVQHLLTDSRRLVEPQGTVFFAIVTRRNSGVRYIKELYEKGVRYFVVPSDCDIIYDDANIWRVDDVVLALQQIVAKHREQFNIPVIGITGSNGKTIVKDWLVQMLVPDGQVVSSPKSYNSQIGVPLSVWQMSDKDRIGVFEAGISEAGEMLRLQKVIKPTLGIFTNIGQAHDENFLTRGQKIAEKLQLFTHCDTLIYCIDHKDIHSAVSGIESFRHVRLFTWGHSEDADVILRGVKLSQGHSVLEVEYQGTSIQVTIPFVDRASQENVMHCIAMMLYLGCPADTIATRCAKLTPVEMRLEMNEATGNCLLINDCYSLDINSLNIALDYLGHINQHNNKALIISDFMQTGMTDAELYSQVASLVRQRDITKLVAIGEALGRCKSLFDGIEAVFYPTTQDFIDKYNADFLQNCTILLKGARVFGFERIAKLLQKKNHETVMEVNLDALIHNLNYYRARLKPTTKLMAMVKASSYGAGRVEVQYLVVEGFGRLKVLAVLIVHGQGIHDVGVGGVEVEGGGEILYSHGVVDRGVDNTQLLESRTIVGEFVANTAEKLHGAGSIAFLFVDESFHEECGAVVGVTLCDLRKVFLRTVVVATVKGDFAQFEQHFLVRRCQALGFFKGAVTLLNIAARKGDIRFQKEVLQIVRVAFEGTRNIESGFLHALQIEQDTGTRGKELGVVRVALNIDVKQLQFDAVGHVIGHFALAAGSGQQGQQDKETVCIYIFHHSILRKNCIFIVAIRKSFFQQLSVSLGGALAGLASR